MASTKVPHSACHIFSFVSGPEDQVVCNGLTGESVTIKRTAAMVAAQKIYDLNYNAEGWGYLQGSEAGLVHLKGLGFNLPAKSDANGRLFIQDTATKWLTYVDSPEEISKGTETYSSLSSDEQLTYISYARARNIHALPVGGPCQPSGSLYWEIRTLKGLIDLSHLKGADSQNRWVKDNYGRSKDF